MPAAAVATATVRARVTPALRDDAQAILDEIGLSMTDVMRMTLTRIVRDRAIPFELTVPNAETRAAMAETLEIQRARRHRFANGQDLLNALEEETGR